MIKKILKFLALSEKLKSELRHSWLSNGRRESVAEHSWQMAIMSMLIHPHLEKPVDLEKTLKMILVHDLVESITGDTPFFENGSRQVEKAKEERKAIEKIRNMLDNEVGEEIYNLFWEFESKETLESKFVKALDDLEVQIQHNLADFVTWESVEYDLVYSKTGINCKHDPFLQSFVEVVIQEAEEKMVAHGIGIKNVKEQVDSISLAL